MDDKLLGFLAFSIPSISFFVALLIYDYKREKNFYKKKQK